MTKRKGILFGFTTAAAVMLAASTAFACVTFMGQLELEGDDGDTKVIGHSWAHAYCSTPNGHPTTAAAGMLNDTVRAKVEQGPNCRDLDARNPNKLPPGTYQVRFNNEISYDYNGTTGLWVHRPAHGCFHPNNVDTASIIGSMTVDGNGDGQWSGRIVPAGLPVFSNSAQASNFCIGDPTNAVRGPGGPPGMLAPYQLLSNSV